MAGKVFDSQTAAEQEGGTTNAQKRFKIALSFPGEIADLILRRMNLPTRAPIASESNSSLPQIDIGHLPNGAETLLGRDAELRFLDAAWAEAGRTTLVELVAPGGVGKTSLVREWLDHLRADGWRGAQRVFGWSFYSQGSSDERQASEDPFLAQALAFFRVAHDPAQGPHDKGRLLGGARLLHQLGANRAGSSRNAATSGASRNWRMRRRIWRSRPASPPLASLSPLVGEG